MEEGIAALLGGLVEVLVEVFGGLIFELLLTGLFRAAVALFGKRAVKGALVVAGLLAAGALSGALSAWMLPHPLVHPSRLHGISVVVSPLLVGLSMWALGRLLRARGTVTTPIENFWNGAAFAFAMALVRLLLVS